MSEEQARKLLALLSIDEKKALNEMLKDLEQKRQPLPTPLGKAS